MHASERPYFFYGRVSSEDQAEDGTIESQQYDLHLWQAERDVWNAGEFWDDPASGTLLLEDRPAALELIEAMRPFKDLNPVLVITRMSRITRGDVWVYACAMRTLQTLNCSLISLAEQFDNTPQGEFVRDMHASVARLHRATILQEMTKGRDRHVRASHWITGPVPFGYMTTESSGQLHPSDREVVSTGFTEAEIAASIFHRFAYEGTSTIAEARRLNAMRVPTARRYGNGKLVEVGSTWLASRVRQMLMNPVYKGVHVFKSKLGTIEREVPALVTSEEWMLANRNLQRNRALSKRNAKRTYLLRGLIRCGDCGAGYAHTFNHSNRPADRPEGYYRCNSQIGAMNPEARTRCQGKMLKAVTLEDYVWSKIKDFAADPQRTLALAQSELRQRLGNVADRAKRESELRRILAGKAEERKRSREASRRGTITLDELKEDLDAIAEETNTLRAELEQLRNERDLAEDQERNLTSAATMLRQVAENAEDISRSNDVDRKRAIAERLVSKIVVTTEIIGQERNNGRLRKQARVDVYFYFGERTAAAIGTTGSASDNNALMLLARLVVGGAAVAA
jgi:site-specific DNA recombinase